MNRIDRLFGILTLLQSKKYVSAESIADKFAISVRTVYRDIRALGEQGIPVSFEQPKGYFIVHGYFLPPVSFSSDEANALLLIENLVNGFSDKSIQLHYSNALNKVKAVLGRTHVERMDQLSHSIKLQVPPSLNYNFDYLSHLQRAISSKSAIDIDYSNSKGEISKRRVEPIGLVFYAMNWHLIGWCHLRKEYRDFKLARIITLKETGLPFQKNDHIDIQEYLKQLPVHY